MELSNDDIADDDEEDDADGEDADGEGVGVELSSIPKDVVESMDSLATAGTESPVMVSPPLSGARTPKNSQGKQDQGKRLTLATTDFRWLHGRERFD